MPQQHPNRFAEAAAKPGLLSKSKDSTTATNRREGEARNRRTGNLRKAARHGDHLQLPGITPQLFHLFRV